MTPIAIHRPPDECREIDWWEGWLAGTFGAALPDDASIIWAKGHEEGLEVYRKSRGRG